MTLTPALRKLTLAAHLTLSVGWIGAVIAFLALAARGVGSREEQQMRAAFLSMGFLAPYVIVPLAMTSLASGLLSALGTQWGLLRHYWVLFKFALTIAALAVLLVQLGPIAALADAASDSTRSMATLPEAKRPLVHAAGGLIVLILVQALGVYKPRGMTRYGQRERERDQ